MKFSEIASRVTGLSCPVFGVQWNPTEAECAVARRVVRFLEDRRVLYVPYDVEIQDYCSRSIIEIRGMLTKELAGIDEGSDLFATLKALRAACRKFMSQTQDGGRGRNMRPFDHYDRYDMRGQMFFTALGELRGRFGIHVARLAAQYGLDVEDELAAILPMPDNDEAENR